MINWKDYLSTADNPVATKMRGGIYACMNQIHANGCMTGFVLGRLGEPVALVWDSYGGHFYGSEDYDLRPISDVEQLERERDAALTQEFEAVTQVIELITYQTRLHKDNLSLRKIIEDAEHAEDCGGWFEMGDVSGKTVLDCDCFKSEVAK